MKKYIGFLIVLGFVVFGASQAQATDNVGSTLTFASPCSITSAPSITVLSPNGGESYVAGQQIEVKWKSCNIPTSTIINIELDQPSTTSAISLIDTGNDGSQLITLPTADTFPMMVYGKNFKIKLQKVGTGFSAFDYSDNLFTINSENFGNDDCITSQPLITVLSPNGGETYTTGQQIEVKWKTCNFVINPAASTDTAVNIKLQKSLSISGQTTLLTSTANDGQEIVTLPLSYGNDFKILVERNNVSAQQPFLGDFSDNFFKITSVSIDNGCANGKIYSSTTGKKCINLTIDPPCVSNTAGCGAPIVKPVITPDLLMQRRTLRVGVKGDDVKTLQSFLGINADGSFGPITKAKVMEWQAQNNLIADGVFGNKSHQKAGLTE